MTSSGESSGQTGLRIDAAREEDTCTIRLSGELDLGNSEQLDAALLEAEASDASRILLDVDELRFIDSTGLRVILQATRRAERTGGRLRVTRGKGYVADMFRLTALDRTDLVAVIGASGSGKSSLVRAGLKKGLAERPVPGLVERERIPRRYLPPAVERRHARGGDG